MSETIFPRLAAGETPKYGQKSKKIDDFAKSIFFDLELVQIVPKTYLYFIRVRFRKV